MSGVQPATTLKTDSNAPGRVSTSSTTPTSIHGSRNLVTNSQHPRQYPQGLRTVVSPRSPNEKLPSSYPANVPQSPSSREGPGAFGKQPTQSIAPFLARHIPAQYAPQGEHYEPTQPHADISNTKYCYRHRPDLKCRRQADEPTMDQLQNELAALPQSDQAGISHVWSLFSAAPSKHRNLMLQGILAQCCFPQLSFIAASVRELIKIDYLTTLPAEIGLRILCFLDPTSLCKAAQVSQRWRTLADDDVVWHKMCEQHIDRKCTKCGVGLPMLDRKRLRTEKRQIQLRASGHDCLDNIERHINGDTGHEPEPSAKAEMRMESTSSEAKGTKRHIDESHLPTPTSPPKRLCVGSHVDKGEKSHSSPRLKPWKDVYRDRFRVGANWKHGRFTMKTFRGHSNGVMCLQFDDTILASGSYDSTIKLWNIQSGEMIRTLTGHELGVRCLQFDDTKLASGSLDGKVKVWDLQSGKCLCTLPGHTGGVIGLHLAGTLLASASADNTIRVWNFQDRSAVTLRGHADWVNAVKIDVTSRTLFSASDDSTICLWDLDTRRVIRTFRDHSAGVQQVVLLPREFECDGLDKAACWNDENANEPSLSYAADASCEDGAKARPLPPRYMLTGGLDATIRLWDIHRGVCLQTFFGHLEGIWALAADTLRAVSGANDGMVKIWDPCTGKCERTFTSHTGPVTCVGLSDRRMCTGSEDHDIKLYSFCS